MVFNKICVCGAGTMGGGIAQVAAQAGFATLLFDVNNEVLERSKQTIAFHLDKLVTKAQISKVEAAETWERIQFTNQLEDCVADICIEAIVENSAIKKELFAQLSAINASDCLFASNTSSLSISQLQEDIAHPERFAGMHFFNPAPLMKLVEIVAGDKTAPSTLQQLFDVAVQMGKVPVHCNDAPGFIVNRVARPYYLEAMRLVESGIATPAEIDAIMEATGFKMGPFALMDLIGLDVNYSVSTIVWNALGKPKRLQPSELQASKVKQGALGRKSGKGFFNYNQE